MLILGLRVEDWLGPWGPGALLLQSFPSVTPALFPDICLCPENLGPCLFPQPMRLCSHRSTCGETCPLWAGGGVGGSLASVCTHVWGGEAASRLELWGWSARQSGRLRCLMDGGAPRCLHTV